MRDQKAAFAAAASTVVGQPAEDVASLIEYPPQRDLGDLALPCFRFAKTLRMSPQDIAARIAQALEGRPEFASAAVVGGYVNVKVAREHAATMAVRQIRADFEAFISRQRLRGHRAAIDYSSPNIAKPFGVGHLRSTMIGQSIVRLLQMDGCETVGINHLGDWGTQFGKNIAAYLKWGDEETVRRDPVRELLKLYVRFHEEAKVDPTLDEEGRAWFKKLEDGDPQAVALWQWFIDESRKVFDQTYEMLGVKFDYYLGESFYNDKMQPVVDELRERGLLTVSEGAEVVDLSAWNMPPCIIVKSDGATIYATRDLAAALYRHDVLGADRLIYVVGAEQSLHFAQVFKVLELMDRPWAKDCRHVAFGMMKYNGERLSTRRGKVVYLEDVLQQAISEARKIIEAKNPSLPDKEAVA
jgi:arginyl-tRNA synthetase